MGFAHGIMLHHFCDDRHPRGQGAITAEEFADMIEWIGPSRILPAQEWQRLARSGGLKPEHLCLTFDDALRCQYDVAVPVLAKYDLTAFWFVYSSVFEGGVEPLEVFRFFRTAAFDRIEDFYAAFDRTAANSASAHLVAEADRTVDYARHLAEFALYTLADRRFRYLRDRVFGIDAYNAVMWQMIDDCGWRDRIPPSLLWMDDECLRRLVGAGHVVGLHSHSHPTVLANLAPAEQRREYERNAAHLSRCLGVPPTTMSHPCNSYNDDTLRILRDMKIELGFRSNMAQPDRSALEMPRRDHADVMSEMRTP